MEMRPASLVMQLPRLGSLFQSRLSFARSLVRKMIKEAWRIETVLFDIDEHGYGTAMYRVDTPVGNYSFVLFSSHIDPDQRSDRVIARRWDLTFVLFEGAPTSDELDELKRNVPHQEAGRYSSRVITLSRANRSQRNFGVVVACLASGRQPDIEWFEKVGYLYRTTAVYGNGKFGLADYARQRERGAFGRPFSAEMFTVYMVRHFTLQQVEHIAQCNAPHTAVALDPAIKRYIGIGNSTGLGMAPFLIGHPMLVDKWISQRERAIVQAAEVVPSRSDIQQFSRLVRRAALHLSETHTEDETQKKADQRTVLELAKLEEKLENFHEDTGGNPPVWQQLLDHAGRSWSLQTQELIHSILLEISPQVNSYEDDMAAATMLFPLEGNQSLSELKRAMEMDYGWALEYDFDSDHEQYFFWYRAVNKEEPRLGHRGIDPGEKCALELGVARSVRRCYNAVCSYMDNNADAVVVDFLMSNPSFRSIIRRIQNLASLPYGDIRANLLSLECRPMDLLRLKLSFFGASKFDPKTDRWVRITLFQGAPLANELASADIEWDWFLPTRPEMTSE